MALRKGGGDLDRAEVGWGSVANAWENGLREVDAGREVLVYRDKESRYKVLVQIAGGR